MRKKNKLSQCKGGVVNMAIKWRNVTKTAKEILHLLHPGKVICVLDTETTSLPRKGKSVKVILFSAIRVNVQ